jgi:3-keto-disaccharide hydrolase
MRTSLVLAIGLTVLTAAGAALVAQSRGAAPGDQGFTDTPMLPGLPYHVHDPARPHPTVVTPAATPGGAPSDAEVLFDGTDLSKWTPATLGVPGNLGASGYSIQTGPAPWKVENGYMEIVPGTGAMATRERFGNIQLHLEWATPSPPKGTSQDRGNSGVFLMGLFETQVLDSYNSPTYADGQAGAIYGQWPPLVNATRPPGAWQTYDIVFEAPVMKGADVVKPAYLTVFLNGVLLHNRKAAFGPTVYRQLPKYVAGPPDGPIVLQDHNHPVRFRNIWIRRLTGYDGKGTLD